MHSMLMSLVIVQFSEELYRAAQCLLAPVISSEDDLLRSGKLPSPCFDRNQV
jgi:hypothetical protein